MSKTVQWIIGTLAVLGIGTAITFLVLYLKEKNKKDEAALAESQAGVPEGKAVKYQCKDGSWVSAAKDCLSRGGADAVRTY